MEADLFVVARGVADHHGLGIFGHQQARDPFPIRLKQDDFVPFANDLRGIEDGFNQLLVGDVSGKSSQVWTQLVCGLIRNVAARAREFSLVEGYRSPLWVTEASRFLC